MHYGKSQDLSLITHIPKFLQQTNSAESSLQKTNSAETIISHSFGLPFVDGVYVRVCVREKWEGGVD